MSERNEHTPGQADDPAFQRWNDTLRRRYILEPHPDKPLVDELWQTLSAIAHATLDDFRMSEEARITQRQGVVFVTQPLETFPDLESLRIKGRLLDNPAKAAVAFEALNWTLIGATQVPYRGRKDPVTIQNLHETLSFMSVIEKHILGLENDTQSTIMRAFIDHYAEQYDYSRREPIQKLINLHLLAEWFDSSESRAQFLANKRRDFHEYQTRDYPLEHQLKGFNNPIEIDRVYAARHFDIIDEKVFQKFLNQ